MNLLEIRQQFIAHSGRYDLATTSSGNHEQANSVYFADTDVGADFFIQGAIKDLDLEQDTDRSLMYYDEEDLAADSYTFTLTQCRNIQQVWFKDTDDDWNELLKKDYDWLLRNYEELGDTDSGDPAYWAHNPIYRDPANIVSANIPKVGVIFMPPTEEIITVRVFGTFHALALSSNTDVNFWSSEYPSILVLACLRNLEGFYRNSQGYNDYDNMIQKKLFGLDKDLAEWSTAKSMQMEG